MPCWFYEKEELDKTPSRKDSIDAGTESRYRREGARFIMEAGTSLNLGYDTMATGVVYFHRFYMFHSFKEFPRYLTGAACLFLAGKVEETPKKCKDIIRVVKELLPPHHYAAFGDDPKEEIMTYERILLQTIKFDLQVEHPYSYLLKYAKSFKGDKDKIQKLVQMAWTFVNDSLCTTLCLQWEPHITAVGFLYLAGRLSKSDLMDWSGKSTKAKWWEQLSEDVSLDIMEEICHQLLDLYAAGKAKAGPGTPSKSAKKKTLSDADKLKDEPKMKALKKSGKSATPPPPPPPASAKAAAKEVTKDKGQGQLPGDGATVGYHPGHAQVIDSKSQTMGMASAPQMNQQLPPQAPVAPVMPPMVSYNTPPPSQGTGYGGYPAGASSYTAPNNQNAYPSASYTTYPGTSQGDKTDQPSFDQKQYDQGQFQSAPPSFSSAQPGPAQTQTFPGQFGAAQSHGYNIPPPSLPTQQTSSGSHTSNIPSLLGPQQNQIKSQMQGLPPHPLVPPSGGHMLPQQVHQRNQGNIPPVPHHLQMGTSSSPVGGTSFSQPAAPMGGAYSSGHQSGVGGGPRPLMSMPVAPQGSLTSMATVRITGRQFSHQAGKKKSGGGWKM